MRGRARIRRRALLTIWRALMPTATALLTIWRALMTTATALLLAGCLSVVAVRPARPALAPTRTPAKTTAAATATAGTVSPNELPSPPPPRQTAPGAASPVAAVTAFARAYVNWSYRDVAARMAMLSRASIGQARSAMTLAAAETGRDSTISQAE